MTHTKNRLRTVAASACLAFVLIASGGAAAAQDASPAASPGPRPSAEETVAALRDALRERYVVRETGAALDSALEQAAARGEFAGLDGQALAERIDAVMKTVTPDGHLYLNHDPRLAAELLAGPPQTEEALPPQLIRQIATTNGGIETLEVLPGNIRYIDISLFLWGTPEAEAAIRHAAEFLRGGAAIVIDLRRNGGGSAEAVAALTSYFLPPDTPLMRFEERGREPESSATGATPFSLAGKPTYVLISPRSFSAAEEFAAHVAAYGYGTLVGETTGGGGFNNSYVALPGGFVASISTGQAVQAKTGLGWERTGIAPAIAVPAERALDRARAEAMARIAATAEGADRVPAQRLAEYYRAIADGSAPQHALATYIGTYGPRRVEIDGTGALVTRRANQAPVRLVSLGGDRFALESAPAVRFDFVIEQGSAVALDVATASGTQQFVREAP